MGADDPSGCCSTSSEGYVTYTEYHAKFYTDCGETLTEQISTVPFD